MDFLTTLFRSVLYGIVQGITEWLPISSTAHLIMMRAFMPLEVSADPAFNQEFWDMYKVVIQLGSILAVAVIFRNRLNPFGKNMTEKRKKGILGTWLLIIAACIPTGIAGVLLDDLVDEKLSSPWVIAVMLVIVGLLLIWMENHRPKEKIDRIGSISPLKAFLIGCCQIAALIPGTSRSGATIFTETMLGFDRVTAVEFSFFIAIPVMLGASLLKVVKFAVSGTLLSLSAGAVLAAGMVTAFAVSMIFIRFMLNYIRTHDFRIFGIYRIALGAVVMIFIALGVLV